MGRLFFRLGSIPAVGLTTPPGGCAPLQLIMTFLLKVPWRMGSVSLISLGADFSFMSLVVLRPYLLSWLVEVGWNYGMLCS